MLRLLVILFQLLAIACVLLMLAATAVIFFQSQAVPVNPELLPKLEDFLSPLLLPLGSVVGAHPLNLNGRAVDMNYAILAVITGFAFMATLLFAGMLDATDNALKLYFRKLAHRFFSWRMKRQQARVEAALFQPEVGAILGIRFEHLDEEDPLYIDFSAWAEKYGSLALLSQKAERWLYRFPSSQSALTYALAAITAFRQDLKQKRIFREHQPALMASIVSLAEEDSIYLDEGFLWGILKTAGPYGVVLDKEAHTQIIKTTPALSPNLVQRGIYSELSGRQHVELYEYPIQPTLFIIDPKKPGG